MSAETTGEQLKLSPIEEAFRAHGVEDLPLGAGKLTKREMTFVLRMLEHGQMARAATEAGYSEASAGTIAAETLRKPKVFQFYRQCVERMTGKGGEAVIRRVYERSVVYHAKAIEAAQAVKDAEEWIEKCWHEESGKNAKRVTEYEKARERAQRDEKHYGKLANETDALLGSLLGKVQGILLSGEVKHTHEGGVEVTVPQSALAALAQVRRDVVTQAGAQRTGDRGLMTDSNPWNAGNFMGGMGGNS